MKKLFFPLFFLLFSSVYAQSWLPLKEKANVFTDIHKENVVLLDSIGVQVNNLGSGEFTIRKVVMPCTENGALGLRIVKYDYDPLTAFAKFSNVKIYRSSGEIEEIDIASACDYAAPARAIYWGARQIMIEIGRLYPGDVLDYTISKKGFTYALLADNNFNTVGGAGAGAGTENEDKFIPPMKGEFYDIVPFWSSDPTVKKVYNVSLPKEKDIQYQFYNGECKSSIYFKEGKKVLTFESANVIPFKTERNALDKFDIAPKLFLSTTPTWVDKSLWFNKVNEDYDSFAALPEAQAKVNELIKGKTGEMEKIAALTHWVADNIRYSGISMGEGEGYTLHNTKMNFTDRCGVCKDKAALLISMLRMAGFEAYPAMTMAGSRVEAIPADHFNHSVAVVKLSNGTYTPLDPTWVPFLRELWSSAEQQQNYLPGIPEGSDLCLTPVSAPENHYVKISANSVIDKMGNLTGELIVEAEGQSDGNVRRPFMGMLARWEQALEQELMNISPNAKLVSVDYGKNPKDYQSAPIKIKYKFTVNNYATIGENIIACKPVVFTNIYKGVQSFLRIDTSAPDKQYGFKDGCSRYVSLKEKMQIPAGYKLVAETLNEEFAADNNNSPASFKGKIEQNNNIINVNLEIWLRKRVYQATDYKPFKEATDLYRNFNNQLYIFEK